jgi:chemotaxis protein MotB
VRRRRPLLSNHDDATREIWPAFTDVMSTMALILFVLVLLAYVRNLTSSQRLDALQRKIGASEGQLQALNADLHRTSQEVEAGRVALQASQSRIHDQEQIIADSNRQLGLVRGQLQSIAVLRVGVLSKLEQAIEAELGASNDAGAPLVTIGDNGNLVLNESLVFESNAYAIKSDAKPLLAGLARALGNLLADDEVRANIDAVVIQGHTDERGSAAFNWDLSAKRATAVLDSLFRMNPVLADSYGRYFAASAYSKFRPLDEAKTPAAYQQNRRIEISLIPRDSNVRKVIDDYVKSVPQALQPSGGH